MELKPETKIGEKVADVIKIYREAFGPMSHWKSVFEATVSITVGEEEERRGLTFSDVHGDNALTED